MHGFPGSFSVLLLEGFHPRPVISDGGSWWIATVLFSCFTMLVVLRVFDYRRLLQLMNGFIRQSSVSLLYREEYALTGRVSVLLLLNYLLAASLFAWQACRVFGVPLDGLKSFGLMAGGIAAAYFIKIVSTRVLGNIFELREAASEYSYNILLFNKTLGLLLFPVALLAAYARQIPSEALIWTGLVLVSIILVYRLLRVVLVGLSTPGVSFFYIILYLCTLEILPLVVVIKVFVGKIESLEP